MTQNKNKEVKIPIKIYNAVPSKENSDKVIQDEKTRLNPSVGHKNNEINKKEHWLQHKSQAEKRKIMWAIVAIVIILILPIWAVFLRYSILIENLSSNQAEKEKEWNDLRDKFAASLNDLKTNLNKKKSVKASNEKIQEPGGDSSLKLQEDEMVNKDKIKKLRENIINSKGK